MIHQLNRERKRAIVLEGERGLKKHWFLMLEPKYTMKRIGGLKHFMHLIFNCLLLSLEVWLDFFLFVSGLVAYTYK